MLISAVQFLLPFLMTLQATAADGPPMAALSEDAFPKYSAALKSYQDSNFEQAKQEFMVALENQPQNPLINYNLGLTEWKLGRKGNSLAMLRRAQFFDPSFSEAYRAESIVHGTLKVKDLPHQISLWESFHRNLLKPLSFNFLLGVLAFTFFLGGVTVPKYLAARRRYKLQEEGQVSPNPFTAATSVVMFVALLGLAVLKFYDLSIERGTIVTDKVEARAGPEPDSSTLFEIFEGLEVIVRRSFLDSNQKEWVQVTYPGGMTGWIPSESLISHSNWKTRKL